MKTTSFIRKISAAVLLAALCSTFVFAREKIVLDEDMRVELNVSDVIFTGLTQGTTFDVGCDLTWKNNMVGVRLGVMARESFLISQSGGVSNWGTQFSFNPYLGVTFAKGGCLMGGVLPIISEEGVQAAPYIGFCWDFNVIPIKNGLSNSLAIRVGADWYPDVFQNEDGVTTGLVALFSVIIPKVYVGVTYQLGKGWKFPEKEAKSVPAIESPAPELEKLPPAAE